MKNEPVHILICDDESPARYGMKKALAKLAANISEAENGAQALQQLKVSCPDIVLCDINMPVMNGLDFLKAVMQRDESQQPIVIMLTAYGSEKVAVEAMKAGAYDYLSKPYDIEELRLVVKNAVEKIQLQRENRNLRQQIAAALDASPMLGESEAIENVRRLISKVSPTDVTVLLSGNSGTGKELAAHCIHQQSRRADGPFVTMNCAAIPKDLVESELFGHEKGAFTGATAQRRGKFEIADSGTLFLDEIADMSLDTQSKILRVLEEKSFMRLGGREVIYSDVRLISASNKNLQQEIQQGTFREDLYFRLKVIEIELPLLTQRRMDIPILVQHFLEKFSAQHRKAVADIDSDAMKTLVNFSWPGNVRQLLHVIEQAVVLCEGEKLTVVDLPSEFHNTSVSFQIPDLLHLSFTEAKNNFVQSFEIEHISRALQTSHGNVSKAANLLQMKRQFLQEKMRKLGINARDFKS